MTTRAGDSREGYDAGEAPSPGSDLAHVDRLAKLGRLTAAIIHELNQPASFVILSQATTLQLLAELERSLASIEDPAAENARSLVRELTYLGTENVAAMDQLRRLVRNVRDFARPTLGSIEPVDVNEIVAAACSITRNELCGIGQVTLDLGRVPAIRCEPLKLMQVIVNLLVNATDAVQARPEGSKRVRVATRLDGTDVAIEVEDDGCGVAPAIRERLFEPFFSTKRGRGSGLGLWLSAAIVKSFGGSIDFESEPGHGTRFVVRMPATGLPQ